MCINGMMTMKKAGYNTGIYTKAYSQEVYALYRSACFLERKGVKEVAIVVDCRGVRETVLRTTEPALVPVDRFILWNRVMQWRARSPTSDIECVPSHGKSKENYRAGRVNEIEARALNSVADQACTEKLNH